jgi:hypothetical protein
MKAYMEQGGSAPHILNIIKSHGTFVLTFIVLLLPSNDVTDSAQITNNFPPHSVAKISFL